MTKVRIAVAGHEIEVEALAALPDVEATAVRLFHETRTEAERIALGFDITNGKFDIGEVAGDVVRAP